MKIFIGNELSETLWGTRGSDFIDGLGGDDTIFGYGTRDTIYGGDGNDRIFTGAGPDVAYGGSGDDFIFDGATGAGVEVLHGGDGNDKIRVSNPEGNGPFAQSATWWLFGDAGKDKIVVDGGGVAHVYGGADRDVIMLSSYGGGEAFGGAGNDVLMSEHRKIINEENDIGIHGGYQGASVTLHGGRGNDVLHGYSANNDTFVFEPGDGRDVIKNFGTGDIWGGDRIDLTAFDFDMSAAEIYDRFAVERDDRIVLNFGADGSLVIFDTPYSGGIDIQAHDVIDALLI